MESENKINENKIAEKHPIFVVVIRLAIIYIAATCFFRGLQNWRNEDYLESISWFLLSFSQIGQLLGLFRYQSKIIRMAIWISLVLALILWVVSKLL